MYTVKSVMTQLVDPEVVLQNVSETLRKLDPEFVKEERQYFQAVDTLEAAIGDSISPSVGEYVAAEERKICAELVYAAWLGFQQNLACFQNPINTMFLKMDYEDFHREQSMHTLPEVRKALTTIDAFYKALRELPEEQRKLAEGITEHMSYLQTVGYKLAHYFGFILADQFLHHVIPGYSNDSVTRLQYERDLREYLQLDLEVLK